MATARPAMQATLTTALPKDIVVRKVEVTTLIPDLRQEVQELVITDDDSYHYADSLLGRISAAKRSWAAVWGRIQEKTVKPLRAALDGLYETNREIEKPLTDMEETVKRAMKTFKVAETRKLQESEAARQAELRRLEEEASKKIEQAQSAATAQMRGRLQAAAARLREQQEAVAEQETPEAVKGEASTTRAIPSWRLQGSDLPGDDTGMSATAQLALATFLQGVLEGKVPANAIMLNERFIGQEFKRNPEKVALWPGIEVYDDIQIVRR